MKAGLLQPFEHVITRLLRAELSGEDLSIEKRGKVQDDDAFAFCFLVSSQLGVRGREKWMGERLAVASGASGEGAVTGLDGVIVAAEEIIRPTQTLRRQDVAAVKTKRAFEPGQGLRCPARPYQNVSSRVVTVHI